MGIEQFWAKLQRAEYRKNDKKYFPLWVRRYAESVAPENGKLPVTVPLVIRFSQSLRDHKTPAWQRLQAVRALEAYRDLVLGTSEPSLAEIRQTLQRLADRERHEGAAAGVGLSAPGDRDEHHLVGVIDPTEPDVLQQLRRELRLRRRALETERAYASWVERFMRHCGSEDLRQFGAAEIRAFLTSLAVEGDVAGSTQDQAKSALLFLYLRNHLNHIVIHRLRTNQPLTADDLKSLETTLVQIGEEDGETLLSDLLARSEAPSLAHFVQSLVGMDRSAAQAAFSQFLNDRSLTPQQMRFVEMVIDQLTARGAMNASALYEPPFSNLHAGGPDELFAGKENVINAVFQTLESLEPQVQGLAG